MNGQSSGAALPGCLIGASRAVGLLDDAPSAAWLRGALDVRWARDPFDRLLAAHARLRGWRIATGDGAFLRHLGRARCIEL
jgi:PIN domain nuclease of toxin-antitoxin system